MASNFSQSNLNVNEVCRRNMTDLFYVTFQKMGVSYGIFFELILKVERPTRLANSIKMPTNKKDYK